MAKSALIIIVIFAVFMLVVFILDKDGFARKMKENHQPKTLENKIPSTKPITVVSKEMEEKKPKENLSKYTSDYFQAGMNILVYGRPDMREVVDTFEHLRQLGVNSVSINFPFYQTDFRASEVNTNSIYTPTIDELQMLIEKAHHAGFSVMIRPIMDEQVFLADGMWRGQIEPDNPEAWFNSYEELLLKYATLAQSTDVKVLNIGTELNSMQRKNPLRWKRLIENIRSVYNGQLMYSFNWDTVNEIALTEFIESLDFVGIDAYFPLDLADHATAKQLEEAWTQEINQFKAQLPETPIVVTEAGIIPVTGAYRTPYAWRLPDRKIDLEAQVHYYQATYNVWRPLSNGIYWWAVTLGQDPNEIGFSPLYSPTEKIMKKQNLKSEWNGGE